ncbi:hypothetical protein ACNFJN_12020 [Xenorhabdus budapestensis]|uniref:hypothetical protein n=1 Tax=Xenorhabdus budapestensis TaxID=290110 RepID=UPI003A89FB8A
MKKINNLDKKLGVINKILSLAFKLGVTLGGAVLLFYCWKIGYFPQEVSVGDGLLLILLAVAFGGVYLFFVVCLTSLGILLRPVWHGLQSLFLLLLRGYEKATGKSTKYTPFIIEKGGIELFIFAIFGLFFIWGYSLSDVRVLATLVLCVWGCALLWSLYQQSSREIDQLEQKEIITDDDSNRLKHLGNWQLLTLGAILVIPLLIGGVSGKLLDGSMSLANVRTNAAVVHIKEPYVKYATEYGLKGKESNFGSEYAKFENVSISFNGFGKNVVIEAIGSDGTVPLVIPADHVHIIQR